MWNCPFRLQTKAVQDDYRRHEEGPPRPSPIVILFHNLDLQTVWSNLILLSSSHHTVVCRALLQPFDNIRGCFPRTHVLIPSCVESECKKVRFNSQATFEQEIVLPCNLGGFLPHAITVCLWCCIKLAGKPTHPTVSWRSSSSIDISDLRKESVCVSVRSCI